MPRHYKRAPIVEAIIDLKAPLPESMSLDVVKSYAASLKDQFADAKPISMVTMGFRPTSDSKGEFHTGQTDVGLRLESLDHARVLQVQRSGFTYSHLPPYSDWATFRAEAAALWLRYIGFTGVDHVSRLAVRVINKIPIGGSMQEASRYMKLGVLTPDGVPSSPERFFTQLQVDGSRWADGCRVLINAGASPQPDGKVEVLLDFDIFVEGAKNSDQEELWNILDRLSAAKDELFEACITDATRELIA
jgi:uncharacterized protein (TIGR04255 family)